MGDQQRPDDGRFPGPDPGQGHPAGAAPEGAGAVPPYVYNPYGNVSYPSTYPAAPAGLGPAGLGPAGSGPAGWGPDDAVPPARRPGSTTLALVLLVVSALPYVLVGFLAVAAAGSVEAVVPPEQLDRFRQAGVDLAQVVRTTGVVLLVVAAVFVVLAVLAWTGRRWARALLAAMTVGFVLMVLASIAAASAQGVAADPASLVVVAGPALLAVVGVALLFGAAARAWFARARRPPR